MPRDTRPLTLHTADGLALAAEVWPAPEAGASGAVVVLVHGFTAHRRDPTVLAMAHELRAAGHTVVAYDMRGHGESEGLCTLGDRERHDVAAAVAAARDLAPRVVLGLVLVAVGLAVDRAPRRPRRPTRVRVRPAATTVRGVRSRQRAGELTVTTPARSASSTA